MHNLPETLNNHPFFRNIKSGMTQIALEYKEKLDNFSSFNSQEQNTIIFELMDLGLRWPDALRQEGFWCDLEDKDCLFKELLFPKVNQMNPEDINSFISQLEQVESQVIKQNKIFTYMGFSKCRICGQINGTKTYYSDLFTWPQGLKHYIKEHGVKPSAAFVLHIRGLIK